MDKNHDTITFAVSLIFRAAIVAAKYSGRVRKRSLKRLAAMDINEKDKENLFLKGVLPKWVLGRYFDMKFCIHNFLLAVL